jgi:hypothetical protein
MSADHSELLRNAVNDGFVAMGKRLSTLDNPLMGTPLLVEGLTRMIVHVIKEDVAAEVQVQTLAMVASGLLNTGKQLFIEQYEGEVAMLEKDLKGGKNDA